MSELERTIGALRARWSRPRPPEQDQLSWAERCLRLLSVHYFAPQVDLIFEPDGEVFIYAGTHEISRGETLGQALEAGIGKLTDAELLAALENT